MAVVVFGIGYGILFVTCDDPTRLIEPPALDRSMQVYTILDPLAARQGIVVVATDVGADARTYGTIPGVAASVWSGGEKLVEAVPPDTTDRDERALCARASGLRIVAKSARACILAEFRPVTGTSYTIEVSAPGRPTARATTTVPRLFDILDVRTSGQPPGTEGISVEWTESAGAHRYFVAMRADSVRCASVKGCPDGWYRTVERTYVRDVIAERLLRDGKGPWTVDVFALDRALYRYLTTGTGGEFFAVPPVSNVEGGHGVVGSWVRRSWRIPDGDPDEHRARTWTAQPF